MADCLDSLPKVIRNGGQSWLEYKNQQHNFSSQKMNVRFLKTDKQRKSLKKSEHKYELQVREIPPL